MMKRFIYLCLASIVALILGFTPVFEQPVSASSDINWSWANPYPIGNELTSVTYANSIFVATGADGAIITSADGETWDIQDSGTSSYLDGATWLDGKFWCVGNGVILNSTDGINWINPNSGSGFPGRNIGYNGSRYVIPSGVTIRYSDDDGVTWNMINLMAVLGWSGYRTMYDIVWDGSQFVVIGDSGTVVTSPDGEIWTEQTTPVTAHLKAITYDGSTFVAIGNGGAVITSPNGISWTQRTSGTASQLLDITWGGSQFVAVGNPSSAGENICVLTSPDGVSWTKHDDDFRASFAGVAYNGSSKYVAVGFSGAIAVSNDGTEWDKISHGTTRTLNDVTWNGSQYIAVGATGTVVTSPDGTNWTDYSLTMAVIAPLTLLPDLLAVTWGNGQFVAAGGYGVIVTSPDGINWTKRYSNLTIGNFRDVIWAGSPLNLFVVGGSKGKIFTSPDGIAWTERPAGLSSTQLISCLAWNGSKLVAAGSGLSTSTRFVATSEDSIIWNVNSFTSQFRDIIWDGSRFMAVESGMTIYTSPDGDTWTLAVTSPPSVSLLNGLVWDGSQYTAVGRVVLHSSDGSTWTAQSMFTDNELNGITWNGDSQYVAVGEHGTILVAGEPHAPSDYELGYEAGYQDGYEDGYSEGQQDGYNQGYQTGLDEGYQDGYSQGTSDGYTQGHNDGYSAGYEAGMTDGYTEGHNDGYSAGYETGMNDGYTEGYNDGVETYRDETPPAGAVHAYPNLLWSPNNKMAEVTISGYVRDELSITRDSGGTGVSSAYLLVNDSEVIPLSLDEDGNYNLVLEFEAKKGAAYVVELYAADTTPEVPNEGLVDTTYIQVPRNQGSKS